MRELHLFIIWNNALGKTKAILEDLKKKFTLQRVYDVHWSDERFSENMSRFYGQKLPPNSSKEVHCGRGPFLAVLVVDEDPSYESRQTSRGPQVVNTKCFDAKERYRRLTGGGHRIHGTNSPAETDHDLVLLLQQTSAEFLQANPDAWNGRVEKIERDLTGAAGWNTVAELLHVLNAAAPYAVLRNFEGLPESATLKGHGDIDLLCTNTGEMAFIANARPVSSESYRVLHTARVGGNELLFDFRAVGDNYYDSAWGKEMLERRVFSPKGFFHLSPEDHFYSLLYHAAVHKPTIAPDYINRLLELSAGICEVTSESFADPEKLRGMLDHFFAARGYRFTEPDDFSVHFNADFVKLDKLSPNRIFGRGVEGFQQLFRQTKDRSSGSADFHAQIFRTKNTARYFHPNRTMFLEALGLPANSSVLEIGGETGVLSRWLGERFKQVTVLESRQQLFTTIELRCQDLKSVKVVGLKSREYESSQKFDVTVALVDSLVEPVIRCAGKALKKSGVLVLGVETTVPFVSKRDEIVQCLKSNGFTSFRYFYPFPNMVMPRVVFSEFAIQSAKKAFGYWAAFAMQEAGKPRVDEFETAGASAEGKLDTIATSCYILASKDPAALPDVPWQVCAASSEARHPSLRATTEVSGHSDSPIVIKRGTPKSSGVFQFEPAMDCPLFEGHTESAALKHSVQTGDLAQFMTLLRAHALHLCTEFAFESATAYPSLLVEGDVLLRGEAMDAIPQNTVIQGNAFRIFDLEWRVSMPLPLSYLLFRGLSVLCFRIQPAVICKAFRLEEFGVPEAPNPFDLATFFIDSLQIFAPLQPRAIQLIAAFEQRFASFVGNGEVRPEEASLFERYHDAISLHSAGNLEPGMKALADMQSAYPDSPEPTVLASVLQGKQVTIDEHLLCELH